MEITAAIIQQFFDRIGTPDEAEAVFAYFYNDPQLLEDYFVDEWAEHEADPLTTQESQEMLSRIQRRIQGRRIPMRGIRMAAAIAASVILVAGMTWLYRHQQTTADTAQTETPVTANWMLKRNSTDKAITILLEDSSLVKMQPEASIKYRQFAQVKTREIYLTGEASFKPTRNAVKPFTVYAGEIATTALGTTFDVAEDREKITIRLFDGRVVVRPLSPLGQWTEPVYLNPGESIVFNRIKVSMEVHKKRADGKHRDEERMEKDTVNASMIAGGNWYMFNNQSLTNVFSQLEELYNVHIRYDPADIQDVYFIGRFNKTDSIEAILNNIALLKKLHILHKENTYIITKKVH